MMVAPKTCKSCNKAVGKKLKLQCGRCNGYFHLACGSVTEVEARIMQEEKSSWNCDACNTILVPRRQSTLFRQSDAGHDRDELFGDRDRRSTIFIPEANVKRSSDTELIALIRELQTEVREMRRSLTFFNEKYEEESRRGKILSDMVSEISRDNEELKKEVQKLKVTLNVQENLKLKNNLCISGLFESSDQVKTEEKRIVQLIQNLCPEVKESDFESLRHIKVNNGIKSVVIMNSLELKKSILKARARKGKITLRNTGLGEKTTPVFIEEELSKETYLLYKKAKQQLLERNYKFVWHRNGRIMARKNEGERYIVIRNESDLNALV